MATLVKFYLDKYEENKPRTVFAYFPQLNYNKRLYGNHQKVCYAHIGQHGSCTPLYASECEEAEEPEYKDLEKELEGLGYELKVLNKK